MCPNPLSYRPHPVSAGSIPRGVKNRSLSRLCYRRLLESRNRRALILWWAYYLDAFSSYPLRTWLPNIYRGHDDWSWHKVRILALPEWYLTDGSGPPEGGLLRLPPKLHMKGLKPIPGKSEAS
ncbi:Metallocarboxypeptidase inhibitor [Cucumis melo var. makuwa]|uniref:Metallocarboxypeptidase inhibitor n=1 Tax=Cucumis melo var. makuwa TaxID=1194695 RepID=A0A5A7SWB0_CUCMM|nr:Metallocarboxypeptidase inhibitor [Cucumis melo var. makuwa]